MTVTFILGIILMGIAMFALSIGVILKKRTPLKGECHSVVDGGGTCTSCGGGSNGPCDSDDGNATFQKKSDLVKGNFELQQLPDQVSLFR